jgi:hypothetical protein
VVGAGCASTADEIRKVEDGVNQWLETLPSDVEVKHVSSAVTAITPIASGKPLPAIVITVWWSRRFHAIPGKL